MKSVPSLTQRDLQVLEGGANASRLNRLLAVEARPKTDGILSSEGEAREEEGSEPSCRTVGQESVGEM